MNNIFTHLMIIVLILLPIQFNEANASGSFYLHKPTGSYNVSYKSYHLINTKACPNIFYNQSNKAAFSVNNPSHCNEIELVIYYPAKKLGSSSYYPIPSIISDVKSFSNFISKADIEQIKMIQSHSGRNLTAVDKQFPVIFFSPGYGVPTQEYENTITELVSHGYIVIGINSQFISGDIIFNNAMVSKVITPQTEECKKNLFRNSYMDFAYIYNKLSHKRLSDPILDKISWNKVFVLGHSLGAATVARFAAYHKEILAAAVLDLTIDLIEGNNCHQDVKTPLMHVFSSQMYQQNKHHEFPYLCKKNETFLNKQLVIVSGNNDPAYSMHMNFCDFSTLQYAPPIMRSIKQLVKNPEAVFLGKGNGINITETINKNLLAFFAKYAADINNKSNSLGG